MPPVVHPFCFCCECGFSGFFRVLPYVQGGGANFFQRIRSEKHSVQDSVAIHNQTESWPWPQAEQPDGHSTGGRLSLPSNTCKISWWAIGLMLVALLERSHFGCKVIPFLIVGPFMKKLKSKDQNILTLIPPSVPKYGSQILLFKVLEVQMCY